MQFNLILLGLSLICSLEVAAGQEWNECGVSCWDQAAGDLDACYKDASDLECLCRGVHAQDFNDVFKDCVRASCPSDAEGASAYALKKCLNSAKF